MIDPNLLASIVVGMGSFLIIRWSLWYFTERKSSTDISQKESTN